MVVSPTRLGRSATEFFCGTPTNDVGPVAEVTTPIFTCACALVAITAVAAIAANARTRIIPRSRIRRLSDSSTARSLQTDGNVAMAQRLPPALAPKYDERCSRRNLDRHSPISGPVHA